ncbi:serine/threonine-protein kinase [Spongiactinospora gelatinilytica]|nr:serine/threonine-protein kinase [Spongiactinospora gelatinilytica]
MSDSQERGQLVGRRYRLVEPIGRGGMGTVWRAHDETLGRDIAIKKINPPPDLSEPERAAFTTRTFREARAAGRISHPGVAAVYDVLEERGHPWIAMELVPSTTLGAAIRERGALPAMEVARIGVQVIAALRAAHLAGVLHRDVKPDNVLLTPDQRAVLTDFGIATMEGESPMTRTGMLVGTPAFMAPERAAGGGAVRASDLWSLGATLYLAVEGRSPFHRGHALATLAAILHEEPPPMSHGGALAPVIGALLRKEPRERPTAEQAAGLLQAVLSGLGADSTAPIPVAAVQAATDVRPSVRGAGCGHARVSVARAARPVHGPGHGRAPRTARKAHAGAAEHPEPNGDRTRPAAASRDATGRRVLAVAGLTGLAMVVAMVSGGAAWLSARPEERRAPVPGFVTTTTTIRTTAPAVPAVPRVSVQAPAPSSGEEVRPAPSPERSPEGSADEERRREYERERERERDKEQERERQEKKRENSPAPDRTPDPKKKKEKDESGEKPPSLPSPDASDPGGDGDDDEIGHPDTRDQPSAHTVVRI